MLAVILAGGKSRRMGKNKAELPFCGGTLLSHAVQNFSQAGFAVYVSQYTLDGTPCIEDIYPGTGPMAGLHAAFLSTNVPILLLCAVDLPFASPELAKKLLGFMQDSDDACVIRRSSGRVEPLFALYRRSCLPHAQSLLEGGEGKMRLLLDRVRTRYIEESALSGFDLERLLLNVNTPEDYNFLK